MTLYKVYSRLRIPEEDFHQFLEEDLEVPAELADVDLRIEHDHPQLVAVPPEKADHSQYTPTAKLKAKRRSQNIAIEDGVITHIPASKYQQQNMVDPDDDSFSVAEIDYLNFYGKGDEVLVNSMYREQMFEVLCQLTSISIRGHVRAIKRVDDDIHPIWVDAGGEHRDVVVTVSEPENETAETLEAGEMAAPWS